MMMMRLFIEVGILLGIWAENEAEIQLLPSGMTSVRQMLMLGHMCACRSRVLLQRLIRSN